MMHRWVRWACHVLHFTFGSWFLGPSHRRFERCQLRMPYPWQDVAFGARPVQQAQVLKYLRLRPGKRLPFLDLPAREGLPSGLRVASLPKEAIELARTELNKSILSDRVLETCASLCVCVCVCLLLWWCAYARMRDVSHMQELGLSFYAVKSRHGAARNGVRLRGAAAAPVHRVQSLGALPACRWLLGEALQLLGLGTALLQAESRCNGLARRYARGQALPRHVDNPMFEAGVPMMHRIYFDGAVREDTIVGVVLKSGEPCDGLRLCQETPSEGSKALLAEAGTGPGTVRAVQRSSAAMLQGSFPFVIPRPSGWA